ncbi:MAG: serine/threonine-protein kinase [Minicystis sp.]
MARARGMAELTVAFVSDGRCTHCGTKHEPWAVVCPVTRLPLTPSVPAVIPAAPRIPAAPVRGVIPPAPAIPGAPRTTPVRRTTPAMGAPRAEVPGIPRMPAIPRTMPAMSAPRPGATGIGSTFVVPANPVFGPPPPGMPPVIPQAPPPPATTPPPQGLVGRVIGERYGVKAVIGEGGMGVVYEAEHLTIGKLVAVKVLHPSKAQNREAVSRLRHEARVAGTLGHPNICAVYDLGRLDDGSPYLVMERLRGETLAQRIARLQRIATADMVDVMLQVLSALTAAHQRGVIHRDLKPENIFLSQRDGMRPVPKLLDFGISKAEDMEETVADPTGQLLAAGTPYYMAPEQARGDRGIDWRVDLWSAGVVLYEGLTGQRPFVAKNYNALLVQILSMAHRSVRELDPELSVGLARVVDKALSKRAEDRYQSALEFQNALRSYKELEDNAPRKALPILISEQTMDDSDATTVFHRIDMVMPSSGGHSGEDESTPIYAPGGSDPLDDERTVVETPAFLSETLTMVRPDPGRKR